MTQLTEKLQKISKYVEETNDDDYQAMLDNWARDVVKLDAYKDYRDLPMTQEIVVRLVKVIKIINRKLRDYDLENQKVPREVLRADHDRCLWFLRFFAKNYDRQLRAIEASIDEELRSLDL
jgi:hypothetical protein